MKIGIITHHYVNNFGAFIQAYAMQETVSRMFPEDEVEIVNFINRKHRLINTLGWFRFYPGKESFGGWLKKTRLPITFAKARKRYFRLSPPVYDADGINALNYDAIIIGSDEVWNYADKKSVSPVKFGYGLKCENIIAYAPSAGQAAKNPVPDFAKDFVKNFSALSARDKDTCALVKSLGADARRVLDPTLLTDVKSEEVNVKKPYILFYYCDNIPEKTMKEILKFASERGLKVYGAGESGKIYDSEVVNINPFQWVSMFKNARYIVTGTFHGVIFSIINRKRFVCYMTKASRIEKVNSLLEEFGLEDRRFGNDTDVCRALEKEIDYGKVYEIIDRKAEESKEYIRASLEKSAR